MTTQENILARHKILHELGRGPSATVYAAHERATGAVVALKRVHPEAATSAAAFVRQARSARRLDHPNIVKVHDAGEAAGTAYVAMALVEGESLRKLLDAGPLPIARAIRILRDVASGLAHAHLEGVVHGALKPSNVLVLPSGAAMIADFGTGHAAAPYRSPEQSRGEPVDHRSDLYSLGVLAYEMLNGQPPSPADATLPPPSELNPNVPRALDPLVSSMLAAPAAARMPGVPVLLRELQSIEDALGLRPEVKAPPLEPRPDPRPARKPQPEVRTPEPALHAELRHGAHAATADAFEHRRISERELLELARAMSERESRREQPARSRPGLVAVLALLAGLGIGVFVAMARPGPVDELWSRVERGIAAARMQEAPATPPATAAAPVAEARAEGATHPATPPETPSVAPESIAQEEPPPAAEPAPPESPAAVAAERQESAPEPAAPPPAEKRAPAKPAAVKPPSVKRAASLPGGTAKLLLAVEPRGELYINGEHQGATPPITALDLEPGMHRIEVRNGSRRPYLTYMTVEPGEVRRIRHDFNARPIRPPG